MWEHEESNLGLQIFSLTRANFSVITGYAILPNLVERGGLEPPSTDFQSAALTISATAPSIMRVEPDSNRRLYGFADRSHGPLEHLPIKQFHQFLSIIKLPTALYRMEFIYTI